MSRVVRTVAATLAACALALGATACSPEPAATPSASATGFTDEAEAFAAAEATYRAYVDALNQVDLADPDTFERVYSWMTGDALAQSRTEFSRLHADRFSVNGVTRVALVESLRTAPSSAELAVCIDVSAVTLTDDAGASAVAPDRQDIQAMQVSMTSAESPTGWLISAISGRVGNPQCPGS
jgi:hypothetical protein